MTRKSLYPRFLIRLPWWFDLLLAALVYYALKNWIGTVYVQNGYVNKVFRELPQYAELFAGILVVNGIISFIHSWRNKRKNKETGTVK